MIFVDNIILVDKSLNIIFKFDLCKKFILETKDFILSRNKIKYINLILVIIREELILQLG